MRIGVLGGARAQQHRKAVGGRQVNSLQRLSRTMPSWRKKPKSSAVAGERQRLARELHDAVSQQLFAISMTATALGLLDKDPQQSRRQVSLIEEMASVAQSEMRALLLHLRPVHLEGKQLVQGLTDLLNEMKQKVPLDIDFDMDEHIHLNKGVEDHLFRIAQESAIEYAAPCESEQTGNSLV